MSISVFRPICCRSKNRWCPWSGSDGNKNLLLQRFESRISGLKPVKVMPNICKSDFCSDNLPCIGPACLDCVMGSRICSFAEEYGIVTLSDGYRDSTNELYTIINQCACPGVRIVEQWTVAYISLAASAFCDAWSRNVYGHTNTENSAFVPVCWLINQPVSRCLAPLGKHPGASC
jgi:hypothetical protein